MNCRFMKKIVVLVLLIYVAPCVWGQTPEALFHKYASLRDRNHLDISKSVKCDIDSLVANNIHDKKHKQNYINVSST